MIGIGTYIWFSWLQRRDQLKGKVKAVCATLSRWRIFHDCCKSDPRVWLRTGQSRSMENPLSKGVELEVSHPGVVGNCDYMDVTKLRERIKEPEGKNKRLEDTNERLRESINQDRGL